MLRSISVQVFPRLVSTPPSCASRNASRWLGARGYIMSEGDRSAEQLTLPKHETHKHTRVHIQTHKQTHTHTQSHTQSHKCVHHSCAHMYTFAQVPLQQATGREWEHASNCEDQTCVGGRSQLKRQVCVRSCNYQYYFFGCTCSVPVVHFVLRCSVQCGCGHSGQGKNCCKASQSCVCHIQHYHTF